MLGYGNFFQIFFPLEHPPHAVAWKVLGANILTLKVQFALNPSLHGDQWVQGVVIVVVTEISFQPNKVCLITDDV